MKRRSALGLLAFSFLAACGSGGGGTAVTAPSPAAPAAPSTLPVAFKIKIPSAPTSSASERRAAYISPGTKAAQVVVNNVTTVLPCSANACSGSVDAPTGNDTFTINLEDVEGNLLSAGSLTHNIVIGTANTVLISCDGIPASAAITWTGPSTFTDGTAATSQFTVNVMDADGYSIIGPWNNVALSLTIDPRDTAHFSIGQTQLMSSSDAAQTLSYDGSTAIHPSSPSSGTLPVELQIVASINGSASGSATLFINPQPIAGPSSVSILGLGAPNAQAITVTVAGYGSGTFTAVSSSAAVTAVVGATVDGSAQVTLTGAAAGTANVTISDSLGATLVVPVTVTTTAVIAQ